MGQLRASLHRQQQQLQQALEAQPQQQPQQQQQQQQQPPAAVSSPPASARDGSGSGRSSAHGSRPPTQSGDPVEGEFGNGFAATATASGGLDAILAEGGGLGVGGPGSAVSTPRRSSQAGSAGAGGLLRSRLRSGAAAGCGGGEGAGGGAGGGGEGRARGIAGASAFRAPLRCVHGTWHGSSMDLTPAKGGERGGCQAAPLIPITNLFVRAPPQYTYTCHKRFVS